MRTPSRQRILTKYQSRQSRSGPIVHRFGLSHANLQLEEEMMALCLPAWMRADWSNTYAGEPRSTFAHVHYGAGTAVCAVHY